MITDDDLSSRPILRHAWKTMAPALQRTVTTPPVIPQIATRAKEAARTSPGFVRGDQGQIVGVLPEREVYYGPSSGLPELRRAVARFWTLAYGLAEIDGLLAGGLGPEHVAVVSKATEGIAMQGFPWRVSKGSVGSSPRFSRRSPAPS